MNLTEDLSQLYDALWVEMHCLGRASRHVRPSLTPVSETLNGLVSKWTPQTTGYSDPNRGRAWTTRFCAKADTSALSEELRSALCPVLARYDDTPVDYLVDLTHESTLVANQMYASGRGRGTEPGSWFAHAEVLDMALMKARAILTPTEMKIRNNVPSFTAAHRTSLLSFYLEEAFGTLSSTYGSFPGLLLGDTDKPL